MAVQSIRTAVQIGDVTGDHLLVAAREMAFGKVDGIRKLDDLSQKIGPHAKAFDDAGDLFPPRASAPEIIGCGSFSCSFRIFDDFDFCGGAWRFLQSFCQIGVFRVTRHMIFGISCCHPNEVQKL